MDLKPYSLSATAARTDPLSGSGAEGVCDDGWERGGGGSEREEERKK